MLLDKKHLIRGQQILTHLGYYRGKIDGIWGPACIEAKKTFEFSGKYAPGVPNTGLPFGGQPPYPAGLIMVNGMLTIVGVDESELPPSDEGTTARSAPSQPAEIIQKAAPQGQMQEQKHPHQQQNRSKRNKQRHQPQNNQGNQPARTEEPALGELNVKAESLGG